MKKSLSSKIASFGQRAYHSKWIKPALGLFILGFGLAGLSNAQATNLFDPPGTYSASWLGNSFEGAGNQWVQDSANKIMVTPDGTIIAGASWDESGRCVGLYKAGAVNTTLLKETTTSGAWGWGTSCVGLGVSGNYIYDATTGGSSPQLITFSWTPGSINTGADVGTAVNLTSTPVGLCAAGNLLAVVYANTIEVRNTYNVSTSLSVIRSFAVGTSTQPASDVAIGSDDSFWVLTGDVITHYSSTGTNLNVTVPGLTDPVSVAFDNQGRLMVCDNGTYQVKFFTVTGATPVLAATFGTANGILSGTPGALAPGKLFNLVGAGTDSSGNIYVGMSFKNELNQPGETANASGNLYLASYTASGTQNWSLFSGTYINNVGFDPNSDGQKVYSATGLYSMNYNNTAPGSEASLTDITLDTKNNPSDARANSAESVLVRYPTGGPTTPTLYTVPVMNEPTTLNICGFKTTGSLIASPTGTFTTSTGWAWDVDSNGGIWRGDVSGSKINYFPIQGWSAGIPQYNAASPTVYSLPSGWASICRIKYIASSDTLYLSGYLTGQTAPTWGMVGKTMACYTGWVHGSQAQAWVNSSLPLDFKGYPPKSFDIAGNYVFLAGSYDAEYDGSPHAVHILNAATGAYVGSLLTPSTLGPLGIVDMSWSTSAFERSNGEYEIMVEDDALAKQVFFRWSPSGLPDGTYTLAPACATGSRLDVSNAGPTSGTNADIYTANTGPAQTWILTNEGGNVYKLQPTCAPSLCLDVAGGGSGSGTNIDVATDSGATSQRWALTQVTGGYTLTPVCATANSLTVTGGGNANGTNVESYTASGATSQVWNLTYNNGTVYDAYNSANTFAGDASHSSISATWLTGNGSVTINNVSADSTGTYTLAITAAAGDTTSRAIWVSVNGAAGVSLASPQTGSWSQYATLTTTVTLNAGSSNTVKLYGNGGSAPDIGQFWVPGAVGEAYNSANTFAGGAQDGPISAKWLTGNGSVTINNISADAGAYTLMVEAAAGDTTARTIWVSVNGATGVPLVCPQSGSWSTFMPLTTTITLPAGDSNTLKFYGNGGNAPDIGDFWILSP